MASRKAREIADVPTRREEERMKARLRELEADNERLEHALQQARHANAKIPVQGKLRTSKGAFVRFFVPDTHGCKVDHEALSAMLADLAYLNPREVYLMGDHLDCDGFLAQHHVWGFVAETEYTFEDDVAAANVMLDSVQNICPKAQITYLQGNHECLDEDHEVLCKSGWKRISEVTSEDDVAQMGEQGQAIFGKPYSVHHYDYDGEMVEVDTKIWRIRMTPNHRTIYRSQDGKRWLEREASDLVKLCGSRYNLPTALLNTKHDDFMLSDDELRLAAWIITDGCLSSDRVVIYQSKSTHHKEIHESLDRCGIQYTVNTRVRDEKYLPEVSFQVSSKSFHKIEKLLGVKRPFSKEHSKLPSWVWGLSKRQFEVFFETMVNADGTRIGECRTLYGTEEFLSEVQRLVVLNGRSCSIRKKQNKIDGNFSSNPYHWCLNVTNKAIRTPTLSVENAIKTSPHNGPVYCLTTQTGNFVIRYRGNVSVTGNSRIERFCVTTALRRTADAEFLRRQIGAENVLHIEKRGIRYISTGKFYDDCRIQGTVRAGKCFVTHGTRHGKNAAQQMLGRFNACVVFGHVHKLLSASDRNVKDGEIGAWSVGHLGQQQPCWRHGDPTGWSQGYGFQIVQPSGDFLHINVPIIEGRSYLYTLGKLLN